MALPSFRLVLDFSYALDSLIGEVCRREPQICLRWGMMGSNTGTCRILVRHEHGPK